MPPDTPRQLLPGGTRGAVLGKLFPPENEYRRDPVGWVEDRLHEHLWSKQREVAQSVVEHRYTAVQSCHGAGKSFLASRLACWWIDSHPPAEAFVVWTAPTFPQVNAIVGREIRHAHRKAGLPGRITLDAHWYLGDDQLVGYGRKPADYDQAAFQGIHARYVLVVIDEACGVPKTLYDAVDSLATNEHARVLAIGNPDDPASHFHDVCKPGSGWTMIRIDGLRTPNFTDEHVPEELRDLLLSPTWVRERRKRWGEGSPLWMAKVRGAFPELSDDALISPAWIRAAQERHLPGDEPGQYGFDIARFGTDETVGYRNRGGVVRLAHAARKHDTMRSAGEIARLLRVDDVPAWVDVIGLGAGVFDRLVEQELPVYAFNAAERATDPVRFSNRRAEVYWHARELFSRGEVDLDPGDEELASQLGSIRYGIDSRGRIYIESKDDMRKRGISSPDRADAFVMSTIELSRWDWLTSAAGDIEYAGITDGMLDEQY